MQAKAQNSKDYGSVEEQLYDYNEMNISTSHSNHVGSSTKTSWSSVKNVAFKVSMFIIVAALVSFGYVQVSKLDESTLFFQSTNNKNFNSALSFHVHVENYGAHNAKMLSAYGYDMILEPHRNLVLKPVNGREGSSYHWKLTEHAAWDTTEDTVLVDSSADEMSIMITSQPPRKYTLELTETDSDGVVSSVTSTSVVSKYVRREFRDLTTSESSSFFSALEQIYRLDYATGVELYGSDFKTYEYFAAKHNSKDWCYHGGMQYLTTHAGFTLDLDKVIQAINASLITPYWDFTVDAAAYGDGEWYKSDIYSDAMFGPVKTSADDGYLITTGTFTEIEVIYDDTSDDSTAFNFATNSFNANTDPGNQVYGDYIMRSTDFCGLTGTQPLPTCSDMITCFEDYGSSITDWETCIEKNVHANFHSINAGAQSCIDDWTEVLEENPTWSDVLAFLGPSTSNIWFKYGLSYGWFSCPDSCSRDSDDAVSCTCTATVDASTMSDDDLYDAVESLLSTMYTGFYMGDTVLEYSDGEYKWIGFSDEENVNINRFLLRHAANAGTIGQVASGAGPNDPLFFAFHPFFDRIYTGYRLSSTYLSGGVTVGWSTNYLSCTGGDETDLIPFESLFPSYDLEFGVSGYYTNAQFNEALDPSSDYVSYVFDSFNTWGNCTYDMLTY